MNKNKLLIVVVILVLVGAGAYIVFFNKPNGVPVETSNTSTTSEANPQPSSSVTDISNDPAAVAARKDLAVKLSVEERDVVIKQVTPVTWNDGCLGLGGPAESCLQALVLGFRVEMFANGKTYIYRTDKIGTVVRAEIQY